MFARFRNHRNGIVRDRTSGVSNWCGFGYSKKMLYSCTLEFIHIVKKPICWWFLVKYTCFCSERFKNTQISRQTGNKIKRTFCEWHTRMCGIDNNFPFKNIWSDESISYISNNSEEQQNFWNTNIGYFDHRTLPQLIGRKCRYYAARKYTTLLV